VIVTAPLETLAFGIGIKPALRVRLAEPAAREREADRWRERGASVVAHAGLLYVARDEATAAALREAEAAVLPDGPLRPPDAAVRDAHRTLGRLLGYPRCCVEAFVERLARGVEVRADGGRAAEVVVAAEDALRRGRRRHARLSFFLPKRRALVPFDPCAFDCQPAMLYADALLSAYSERDRTAANELAGALLGEVRLAADGARLRPDDPRPHVVRIRWDTL